jgi:hypothetical protein
MVNLSSIDSYIHKQALATALITMMINSLLIFFNHRNVDIINLLEIVVGTIITSVIMTWLVTIFSVAGINHQLHAGHFKDEDLPQPGPILSRLLKQGVLLGIALFVCAALIMGVLTVSLSSLFKITELSVSRFVLFTAIYTFPVAYVAARLAIIRQL